METGFSVFGVQFFSEEGAGRGQDTSYRFGSGHGWRFWLRVTVVGE